MRIYHDFEYSASYSEIANEFTENDSEYQANVLNVIGTQFKKWVEDKTRTVTYIQILEIAEQLSDNGKWFIKTLCEYIDDKAESEKNEKLLWLGKNCKDCGNEKCKKLCTLPKGYDCALYQAESEK